MSFTKRQIVEGCYGELALTAYTFDLSADEVQAGLARIESMLRWDFLHRTETAAITLRQTIT